MLPPIKATNESASRLTPDALKLLQTIESTYEESLREQSIAELSVRSDKVTARALIETYERCMWRSTKIRIIQALGAIKQDRATFFLAKLASNRKDLSLAGEAILALGMTDDALAGEFLLSIIHAGDHPLAREAVLALTNLTFFPCEDELEAILRRSHGESSPTLLQYAIIALGIRGRKSAQPLVEAYLTSEPRSGSGGILNAAVLATGRLGGPETLPKLAALDTRYRFFAHQLKLAAAERITLRMSYTIEDALSELLAAKTEDSLTRALRLLQEFPEGQAKEAFDLLGEGSRPDLLVLAKAALFDSTRLAADLKFLGTHHPEVDPRFFVSLVRRHYHGLPPDKRRHVLESLRFSIPVERFIGLLEKVRVVDATAVLDPIFANSTSTVPILIQAVNALVAQCVMSAFSEATVEEVGDKLFGLLKKSTDGAVQSRLLRAIGQIGYGVPAVMNELRTSLRRPDAVGASTYAAFELMATPEASQIVTRRLRTTAASTELSDETARAIETLAAMGKISVPPELALLPESLRASLAPTLLKIMTENTVDGFEAMLEGSLRAEDFQIQILAIAAARHNMTDGVAQELFRLVDNANVCIAGRALDSLCFAGKLRHHLQLLTWLKSKVTESEIVQKFCRSLVPEYKVDYKAFLDEWEKLIVLGPGVFADKDVATSAVNLRDNLLLATKFDVVESDRSPADHSVDAELARKLLGFTNYSETVKSVLRNAELIHVHPELFDNRVDKSTAIVQYVKSIDILLQERVGSKLFLSATAADLLSKMQSRIVSLQLDDESMTPLDFVTVLQCGNFFSSEDFPAAKLQSLVRSIMTGKIIREQYKVVDGLRAWALLLLTFGRTFKAKGTAHESLFALRVTASQTVGQMARSLNQLQELRNLAAHRGTLRESAQVGEMRSLCFSALNEMNAII